MDVCIDFLPSSLNRTEGKEDFGVEGIDWGDGRGGADHFQGLLLLTNSTAVGEGTQV